jgi:hypothetical protein
VQQFLFCILAIASTVTVFAKSLYGVAPSQALVLHAEHDAPFIDRFNAADRSAVINLIPDDQAWSWIVANAPLFDCPSTQFEEIYYFRWWTYRKHIRQTPQGRVLTEFLTPVSHAGPYNTIACALGHHLAEGRWLRDQTFLDEYVRFWYRGGKDGGRAEHFHNFSSWAAAALYERALVTGDWPLLVALLDDLVADYEAWEQERQRDDGLFWQYDVRDGMEESISGSRTAKNVRPTINSYMVANARAIEAIARKAGRPQTAAEFAAKADALHAKMIEAMWDADARFFKVRLASGELSEAREAIGYIPWMFDLARPEHAEAWRQIKDPDGFWAPWGLTTAERRHPQFRTHGTGTCEWDGAVWPFATSQTLRGLANLLRSPSPSKGGARGGTSDAPSESLEISGQDQTDSNSSPVPSLRGRGGDAPVTRRDFFEQMLTYARSHQQDGQAYIGEYLDETTGQWLITGPKAERSRYYNHSTFNDLVISGLVGLVPRDDDVVEIDPLIPADAWDWFCLDGVPYHGRSLTIAWDRTGRRYGRGAGLAVWVDGMELARGPKLTRATAEMPPPGAR